MSYTLRGRLESRLAALLVPLLAATLLASALRAWWPLELAGAMIAALLALDVAYSPALRYQPGWAAVPLGLLELGVVMATVLALGLQAPVEIALALFAAGWLAAQVLGHALLPLWRLSYAEDGGEVGRTGVVLAAAVAVPFTAAGALWWSNLPPVVHLGAGVVRGPLVVDRREHLVGSPGTVVVGGIVIRHSDVKISNVRVVGGENGISVDGYRNITLDHVSVAGSKLDGIHVRNTAVTIRSCSVDMRGSLSARGSTSRSAPASARAWSRGARSPAASRGSSSTPPTACSGTTASRGRPCGRSRWTRCPWAGSRGTRSAAPTGSASTATTTRCA